MVTIHHAAIFSNWIPFKRLLERLGNEGKNVIVDLFNTQLVDHSVVERLHQMEQEFAERGQHLEVIGISGHRSLSGHPLAARKRGLVPVRRITLYANVGLEARLLAKLTELGATGYSKTPIVGAGRHQLAAGESATENGIRVEVVVTREVAHRIITYIDRELLPDKTCHVTACVEHVLVVRANAL